MFNKCFLFRYFCKKTRVLSVFLFKLGGNLTGYLLFLSNLFKIN